MHFTQGKLYDGLKSTPILVDVKLDEQSLSVLISNEITKQEWLLSHTSFEEAPPMLELHYGESPRQVLKVEDEDFIKAISLLRKKNGHLSFYEHLVNKGLKFHLFLTVLIFGVIALGYFTVLPWFAERAVVLIPEEYDSYLSDAFVQDYLENNLIDSAKTKLLKNFAANINFQNTKPFTLYVIKSEMINAFAMPDGSIVVFTGIIDEMKSYEELAALLSHEATHVNERHSMKMLCRNLSGYLFLSMVTSDVNGIMTVLADNVNSLQSLTFSRKFEKEADTKGFELLVKNRINPKGMITLFERLEQDKDLSIPEFLSSHPLTGKRIKEVKQIIAETPTATYPTNETLRAIFKQMKSQ